MLILIVGVTGNVGHHLCRSALRRGHQVRGLCRNPNTLQDVLLQQLESCVVCSDYQDQDACEQACKGVDAVISALGPSPTLILDAQLILLRAAEKASIKRFHGASWNGDWSGLQLGDIGSYDAMLSFTHHAFMTSKIRPCHTFTGVLASPFFAVPGKGRLEGDDAMWVRKGDYNENKRIIKYIGSPNALINFTTEEDAADFSVALITSDYGEKGGFYRFWSDSFSPKSLKETFEKVRPNSQVELEQVMELAAIHDLMIETKAKAKAAGPIEYQAQAWNILGLEYGYHLPRGTLSFDPVDAKKFPECRRTSLAEYIKENEYV